MEDTASDNSLPFGQGASAFGSDPGDEDDYNPERRLSLDLMHWEPITHVYDVERAASPAPSYVSMKSDDWLNDRFETEADEESPTCITTKIQLDRQDSSASSCCSFCSDEGQEGESKSERKSQKKSCSQPSPTPPLKPELLKDPNEKRHPALTVEFTFKALQSCLQKLAADELKSFKRILWERYPECFRDPLDGFDIVDVVDKMLEICDIEVSLKITQLVLRDMNLKKVADYLQGLCKRNEVRYELKITLKRKYENIYEGLAQQTLFEAVYTDLYITDGGNAASNSEHEFRQIEELQEGRFDKKEVLSCRDIFNPEIVKTRYIRTLLTKGSPGIGKSSAVQRFILDWVDGTAHQDVFFLLPLPFKELNQMADAEIGFMDLICRLYPEMKEVDNLEFEGCSVMFICDGLDDCNVPIDFRRTAYWCDQSEPTTLKILITNLIRGNLLYSAYVWITTRPITINLIPPECIHQITEVRGFTNEQREAYFRKAIADKELAESVITYIKSCRTLYIMCHMPLFCWVVRNVLERELHNLPTGAEFPKALTHFYTKLLLVHISMRGQKLQTTQSKEGVLNDQDFVMKLGKMAFQLLEKSVFRIEKENWKECGLDAQDAVVTAGLCTQFHRERFVMYYEKVDCFVHPTMQEYLAALFVFLSFKNHGKNVLEGHKFKKFKKEPSLVDLQKNAVDKAMHAKDGNYDIFLRFFLGMSVEANQDLLRSFLSSTGHTLHTQEEISRYIRKKIKENHHPERNENLQMCLDELFPQIKSN
ncbi:NLR family CARD domain-containing protein 3 [Electrophorus electricus]|uniref:Pyrin domain-containing protein n=1 Tax=Electrophorus electricus TaxID=8005 RepID=A0A4W4EFG1_ELEEL|nr:NLR family CARD domain-containing protein 3 [Electrophorus electricus]